jgi:serine/threonine protein kinase
VIVVGTSLLHYRITAALGAGGMGEVYRATDTKLGREVAIKVLPAEVAGDVERLARFEREAKLLASLSHGNIAHVYGFEAAVLPDGSTGHFLAMELVAGEDLATRLQRGAIPVEEGIAIARQIAQALEEAHAKGIVHRDLKPANVRVTPEGKVKVLDFGLAKAYAGEAASGSSPDLSKSPTLARAGTQAGVILGTAAYMSPEQARGKPVDKRADIWAFGVVLFEMLTGQRLFEGETVSDTLAAVLKTDPQWSRLPAETPGSVVRLLRRCLERDPGRRLHDIGDARLDLEDSAESQPPPDPRSMASPASRLWWLRPAAAGALATAVAAGLLWQAQRPESRQAVTRLSILSPAGAALYPDSAGVAISPDGTMVAFVVGSPSRSESQLWVRSLDSTSARRLEDGDGASLPFWSPDSRRIGFFTTAKLKTISASGGRAEVLCDAPNARGATWGRANVIVFAPNWNGPLQRISASGGAPAPATKLDAARGEYGHRFPAFLPDGEHFLFAALPGKNGEFDIFAGSLADGSRALVGSMESAPVYAEPGWLLFARQGLLAAQPFDVRSRRVTGDPVLLEDEPTSILDPAFSFTAGRAISVSGAGSLAYFSAPATNTNAVWLDLAGRTTGRLSLPAGHYETVTISPDGTRAVLVRSTSPSESSLWLVDLTRGGAAPLSAGHGRNDAPVWSPDGTRVVFASDRDGPQDVYVKVVANASPEVRLFHNDAPFKNPSAWSSDGRWIVITQLDAATAQDVWLLPASGKGELVALVKGPVRDNAGPLSPDGRWLAHTSDDTGRFELYLQSLPPPGRRVQVSQGGAMLAWWAGDGRSLQFVDDHLRSLWRVELEAGAELRVGTPRQIANLPPDVAWMDATPDRQKFIAIVPERAGPGSVTVVQNWRAALARK